ncbi:MAG TPA: hypothetical protein VGX92_03055 [Pyrinomonadaceae bacterium]|jgi:hypothetical protein|nr:hypothetical protein [Pyrinomonadaceae bacterium]
MKFFKSACAREIDAPYGLRPRRNRLVILTSMTLWLLLVGTGMAVLLDYENTPGAAAKPPMWWPAESRIKRPQEGSTLIMLAHPHCPCTRASINELALLMAHSQGRLSAYVLFLKPSGFSEEWEKTDLWQSAASIPGVQVVSDDDGVEARRFHATTSGHTSLYDADGRLVFSGGITGARGHSGDNAGRSAVESLLNEGAADRSETFVFGCPLFDENSECRKSKHESN